jgi:hypothetical protein
MRVRIIAALAVVGLACVAGQARAQQAGFTPQQLDEMSKQRMQAIGPRNWGLCHPLARCRRRTSGRRTGSWSA